MGISLSFDNVSKSYRIGAGHLSLRHAINKNLRKLFIPSSHRNEPDTSFWALKNVSFEMQEGSALGLIGPNGAGKTTILKLLANITKPTTGKISIKGRVSALIELGAGFHPDLTGRENIFLNGSILGLSRPEINKRFDQIVSFSGIERFIDTPVKRYSSGMYVRLGFAIAAHVEPQVLIVDEVLSVGDAAFRQKCAKRIDELKKRNTTIVFVSHNLYLVKSICDRVIFLAHGRIHTRGDSVSAINAYQSWLHNSNIDDNAIRKEIDNQEDASTLEIIKVEIRNLSDENAGQLHYDDTFEIQVFFKTKDPLRKPNLVLRIVRADGTTCCMIRTSDYGDGLDDLEGEGFISVAIAPLQLSGGAYVVNAKLMSELIDGEPLAHGYSKMFEVIGKSLSYEELSGVFVPNVAWARVLHST